MASESKNRVRTSLIRVTLWGLLAAGVITPLWLAARQVALCRRAGPPPGFSGAVASRERELRSVRVHTAKLPRVAFWSSRPGPGLLYSVQYELAPTIVLDHRARRRSPPSHLLLEMDPGPGGEGRVPAGHDPTRWREVAISKRGQFRLLRRTPSGPGS